MPERPRKNHALTERRERQGLLSRVAKVAVDGGLGVLSLFVAWLFMCLPILCAVGFSSGYLGVVVWSLLLVLAIEDFFDLDFVGKHKLYRKPEDRPERLLVGEDGERYIGEHRIGDLKYDASHSLAVPKRRRALWIARLRLLLPASVLGISDMLAWSAGETIFAAGWSPDPIRLTLGFIWFIWFGMELFAFGDRRTRATRGLVAQQLLTARGEGRRGDLMLARDPGAEVGALSLNKEGGAGAISLHGEEERG